MTIGPSPARPAAWPPVRLRGLEGRRRGADEVDRPLRRAARDHCQLRQPGIIDTPMIRAGRPRPGNGRSRRRRSDVWARRRRWRRSSCSWSRRARASCRAPTSTSTVACYMDGARRPDPSGRRGPTWRGTGVRPRRSAEAPGAWPSGSSDCRRGSRWCRCCRRSATTASSSAASSTTRPSSGSPTRRAAQRLRWWIDDENEPRDLRDRPGALRRSVPPALGDRLAGGLRRVPRVLRELPAAGRGYGDPRHARRPGRRRPAPVRRRLRRDLVPRGKDVPAPR